MIWRVLSTTVAGPAPDRRLRAAPAAVGGAQTDVKSGQDSTFVMWKAQSVGLIAVKHALARTARLG
jgi:hypothetical protein